MSNDLVKDTILELKARVAELEEALVAVDSEIALTGHLKELVDAVLAKGREG